MDRPRATKRNYIVFLLALVNACEPLFKSGEEVQVTGEFRSDGSCEVTTRLRWLERHRRHWRHHRALVPIFAELLDVRRRSTRGAEEELALAEPRRHRHQLRERVCLHLPHHLAAMCLHRDLADPHPGANLFVQQTGGH